MSEEARFAVSLAEALHTAGAPAHRLEDAMARFSEAMGLGGARFVVLSGAILASFEEQGPVSLMVPRPSGSRLDHLIAVDALAEAVSQRRVGAAEGRQALAKVMAQAPPFGPAAQAAAAAGASAAAALIFGGGPREAAVAAAIALWVWALALLAGGAERQRGLPWVMAFVSGAVASVVTGAVGSVVPLAAQSVLLGALVMLLPGFTLTTALTEVATGHLVSGTARLLAALTTLVQLALGAALGGELLRQVGLVALPVAAQAAHPLVVGLVLIPVAVSFAVLLQVPTKLWGYVVLGVSAALLGAALGRAWLGPALGSGLGALLLTAVGNAAARRINRPAALLQVPGMLVLVPGSLGLRATSAFVGQDLALGTEAAVATLLLASSLVAGSLLGNALVAPRRAL